MKTGLVLEGGAMRGMFTAGVMDVLMKNGVELSVSRSKYAAVRAAYLEWKGQFGDE